MIIALKKKFRDFLGSPVVKTFALPMQVAQVQSLVGS